MSMALYIKCLYCLNVLIWSFSYVKYPAYRNVKSYMTRKFYAPRDLKGTGD